MSIGTTHIVVDSEGITVPAPEVSKMGSRTRARVGSIMREHFHNRLQAKYDVAQTTPENEAHWAAADNLSADSSVSPEVRKKIRERSRYEAANSSFYAGALDADAASTIGTGPNKRFFFGDDNVDQDARELYSRHARHTHLAYKMRLMRKAFLRDGEILAVKFNNSALPASDAQLDISLVDCDRLEAPYSPHDSENNIDGVILDSNGIPKQYQILDRHPGDLHNWAKGEYGAYRTWDAADVVHYFNAQRPGQHRGLPAVTPCLALFAQFRRYKLAVLTAAETAANVAAMLKLDTTILAEVMAEDSGSGSRSSNLLLGEDELFDLVRGSIPALPPGYSIEQMKAEQPTSTLDMFERVLLREISRCFGQTYSVIAGDSSNANMASGNLDERRWWSYIDTERSFLDEVFLDKWTSWWWSEQRRLPYLLPHKARGVLLPKHKTTWPSRFEHNDPAKVANAAKIYHELGLLTDDEFLERRDINPTEHFAELERQVERRNKLGLPPVGIKASKGF